MAEGREKIRRIQENLTHEDVVAALKDTVIQSVTPLAHLDYPSQLKQKHEWLRGVLDGFTKALNKEMAAGIEVPPTWFTKESTIPLDDTVI